MSDIGKPERATQTRVVALFREELGYRYVGDWSDRDGNSNIEEGLLTPYLATRGYSPAQISAAIYKLRTEARPSRSQPLRQQPGGLQPSPLRRAGEDRGGQGHGNGPPHRLGRAGEKNDFVVAEECHAQGRARAAAPTVVLYVNGIAIGVLELKNSRVSIGDGIRQNLSNQQPEFNERFFSTVQVIFAGNDSEACNTAPSNAGEVLPEMEGG